MKHCDACKLDISGDRERCPLCQTPLSGEPTPEIFPLVPTIYRQFNMFFKLMMFISVIVALVTLSINLLMDGTGFWSLFVLLGIACVWISLAIAVRKRKNIPKGMLYQVFIVSVLCVIWDFVTGWHRWSVDFVIPMLCLSCIVAMAILSKILSWSLETIIIYFWIAALFGIVPIVFYFLKILRNPIPSIICVAGSLLCLSAIIIFNGSNIWSELKRKFSL